MVQSYDPNEVLLTGENSFIRLHQEENGPRTTRASHWRILHCPSGPGHVLYIQGELTDNEPRIYSDNIAMTRWLQNEIEGLLDPNFADQDIPVTDAVFTRAGDSLTALTEVIESEDDSILMTWYDFEEPFMMRAEVGTNPDRPHLGVYSCFIAARRAQLTINGDVASGRPFPEMRGEKTSSTACLAWSETWVKG
jgi:hypothetical protein